MKPFRIADKAQGDLASIWDFIAVENDAPEAADKVMNQFELVFRQLGKHPLIGRSSPEFGFDLRSFPQGNYIIVYRPTADGVDIVRVLHGSRNMETLFED